MNCVICGIWLARWHNRETLLNNRHQQKQKAPSRFQLGAMN
jgi:hypothetical protein